MNKIQEQEHFPVNAAILSIVRSLLHLSHKERTEFVNHVDSISASSQIVPSNAPLQSHSGFFKEGK